MKSNEILSCKSRLKLLNEKNSLIIRLKEIDEELFFLDDENHFENSIKIRTIFKEKHYKTQITCL